MINKPKKRLVTELDHILDGLTKEQQDTVLKLYKIQRALYSSNEEVNLFSKNNYVLDFCKIWWYIEENPNYTDETVTNLVNQLYNRMFKKRWY